MAQSCALVRVRYSCLACLAFLVRSRGMTDVNDAGSADLARIAYLKAQSSANYVMVAFLATLACCVCAVWVGSLMKLKKRLTSRKSWNMRKFDGRVKPQGSIHASSYPYTPMPNGVFHPHLEKHSSMVEELVPEITHHALSYLDYKSLCRVSMTNSAMRRVANDDSAWRALYHKDYTAEQDAVVPRNGWKAHYAVTKAVAEVNKSFYKKFRAKSLGGMSRLWLKADYVKCIHPGGELLSGYDLVMENWRVVFNWSQRYEFQLIDVRVRVTGDIAWVTAKEFVNQSGLPLLATNCYEFHDGQWYIVHHHSSPQVENAGADFRLIM